MNNLDNHERNKSNIDNQENMNNLDNHEKNRNNLDNHERYEYSRQPWKRHKYFEQ